VLLSSCLFFGLVITCGFQSSVLGMVCYPRFQQKLVESGLPTFTLDPNLMDIFHACPSMRNLVVRLEIENLSQQTLLHHIAYYRNFCMQTNKGQALRRLSKHPEKLNIINNCAREYFVSYICHIVTDLAVLQKWALLLNDRIRIWRLLSNQIVVKPKQRKMQPWENVSSIPDANTVFEGQKIRHRDRD
jgi:hypothetical protein